MSFDYGSRRWKRTSYKIRAENGWLCRYCDEIHQADVVDHIVELSDVLLTPNYLSKYAFNKDNLIPCCHQAHSIKTNLMKRIRRDNNETNTKANHPIIYYENLSPIIDVTDISIVKEIVIDHIRTIK